MHNSELSIVYIGLDAINRRHWSKFGSKYLLYFINAGWVDVRKRFICSISEMSDICIFNRFLLQASYLILKTVYISCG